MRFYLTDQLSCFFEVLPLSTAIHIVLFTHRLLGNYQSLLLSRHHFSYACQVRFTHQVLLYAVRVEHELAIDKPLHRGCKGEK